GGGTNCRVRLADESLRTLAETTIRKASNLQVEAGDAAFAATQEGIDRVFADAGLDRSQRAGTYACLCMAGGRSESARDAFAARDWRFGGVRVYDDIDAAHAGALGGEDGAVI